LYLPEEEFLGVAHDSTVRENEDEKAPWGPYLPERIAVEGTYNIRDLGVYTAADGTPLRRGVFFRGDNLGWLGETGRRQVRALGVRSVIDLRASDELERSPNAFLPSPAGDTDGTGAGEAAGAGREFSREPRYFHYNVVGDTLPVFSEGDTLRAQQLEERLPDGRFRYPVERLVLIYTSILDNRGEQLRSVLSTLAEPAYRPALYHCVAGQDRTGLVSAILLSLAEVSEEVIVADYTATAAHNIVRFLEEKAAGQHRLPLETSHDYAEQLCPPDAMRGTLGHLNEVYGSVEDYLGYIGLSSAERASLRDALRG
jgi:protein-tyrosine phosphatase